MIAGQSLRGAVDLIVKTCIREGEDFAFIIAKPWRLFGKIHQATFEFGRLNFHPSFLVGFWLDRDRRKPGVFQFSDERFAEEVIFNEDLSRIVLARMLNRASPQRGKLEPIPQYIYQIVSLIVYQPSRAHRLIV